MKFNFKNKEVLPKALRDSLKNDDVTETDEVGASNPPGAARRSRRTDVIPKDVDISHPPFNVSKFLVKNHKDFDVLDTGEAKRRGLGFCSPLAQELRKFKVPDISDEEIIRMIRSGDRTGNFLLLCKHYKYILKKLVTLRKETGIRMISYKQVQWGSMKRLSVLMRLVRLSF